jgi:NAD(P)-dependent dehydrogenase (short-subunit alcohol dehydrogenase family)
MAIADVSDRALLDLMSLDGRRAVVTGGAKGIGRAIVRRLAEAGAYVIVADLDEAAAQAAAEDLNSSCGGRISAHPLNVADTGSIGETVNAAIERLGGLDIWVNNAGIYPSSPLLEMTDAEWDKVLDVNLRGAFIASREAARRMVQAGRGGAIINIVSTAGFNGSGPGLTHYVASKHGLRGVIRQMALELAPHGIRVLGVAPTVVVTEGVVAAGQSQLMGARTSDEVSQRLTRDLLGRLGTPDDIARVVFFCASDLSLFMTGSTLLVDAGQTLF